MVGWTVGAKLAGGNVNIDIGHVRTISRSLERDEEFVIVTYMRTAAPTRTWEGWPPRIAFGGCPHEET